MKWSELSARQRNELVAVKVMGCSLIRGYCGCKPNRQHGILEQRTSVHIAYPLKRYSTEIAAAWEVLECAFKCPTLARDVGSGKWAMWEGRQYLGALNTAPEAICLAALKACGVEIE